MNYKVVYINLDRSPDRRKFMEKNLNESFKNTPIERIRAIDGKTLTPEYVKSILDPRSYYYLEINNHKRVGHEDLNKIAHIACFLSHAECWKQLVNDSVNNYYIIFEDDVKPIANIQTIVNKFVKQGNFDFISLFWTSARLNDNKVNDDLILIRNPFFGMMTYILNKKAASTFLKWSKPFTAQVDAFVGYVCFYEKLNAYLYKQNAGETSMFNSLIEHGNCLNCETDNVIDIRIDPDKKEYYRGKSQGNKNMLCTLIFLILICLVILIHKNKLI